MEASVGWVEDGEGGLGMFPKSVTRRRGLTARSFPWELRRPSSLFLVDVLGMDMMRLQEGNEK